MAKNFNAWPDQWPKSQNYPQQPVFSFLDQTAMRVTNRLVIIFGGMELTCGELINLSDRFANLLISLGLKKGPQKMPGHVTSHQANAYESNSLHKITFLHLLNIKMTSG